jgi:hypothetical protein
MAYENDPSYQEDVARAAAILIEVSGGPSEIAIARAERQLEMSKVKPFAAAVLEEVKRICSNQDRPH